MLASIQHSYGVILCTLLILVKTINMDLSRIHWAACRRGMLELDVILERYVKHRYSEASQQEQQQFVALLEANDQDLFTWLVKREQWDTCAHLPMVQTLLETASTRL